MQAQLQAANRAWHRRWQGHPRYLRGAHRAQQYPTCAAGTYGGNGVPNAHRHSLPESVHAWARRLRPHESLATWHDLLPVRESTIWPPDASLRRIHTDRAETGRATSRDGTSTTCSELPHWCQLFHSVDAAGEAAYLPLTKAARGPLGKPSRANLYQRRRAYRSTEQLIRKV